MKTAEMMFRDRPSSRFGQLNWPFLTFWVMYISVMLGIGYTLL